MAMTLPEPAQANPDRVEEAMRELWLASGSVTSRDRDGDWKAYPDRLPFYAAAGKLIATAEARGRVKVLREVVEGWNRDYPFDNVQQMLADAEKAQERP